jgi:hypothetical protein
MNLPGNTCIMDFFGDLRLRHESRYNSFGTDRDRERIRLRFGANFEFSDQLKVGFRVRSGNPDDPNSPHHTMSSAFDSIDFNLDRAFAQYTPCWAPGVTLLGGKFGSPFATNPVYSELVWDADINPEGAAIVYDTGSCFRFVGGGYVVTERGSIKETSLFTAQLLGRKDVNACSSVEASVGYYYYDDMAPGGDASLQAENQGNVLAGADYASDFEIWNTIVAYKYDGACVPIVFSSEYIYNDGAFNDQDEGWAVGASAGQTSSPGDSKVFYQYQDIEQESIFSGFANDDFPYATNFRGHVFGVDNRLGKAASLRLWALNSERTRHGTGYPDYSRWTLRADLNIKF